MSLQFYFNDEDLVQPPLEVSVPVKYGYLIRNAFTLEEIREYFVALSLLPWLIQEIVVAGTTYMPMRQTLAFADGDSSKLIKDKTWKGIQYNQLFNTLRTKLQNIIIDEINEIKDSPELNFCWGNRYRDGRDKVGKHKDDERGHSKTDPIVSLSFGTHRFFDIYRENKMIERVSLGMGDIFLMMPGFQDKYFHAVPKQLKVKDPRINLTFRSLDLDVYEK